MRNNFSDHSVDTQSYRRLLARVTEEMARASVETPLSESEHKNNDYRSELAFLARSRANNFRLRAEECAQLAGKSHDQIMKQYYEEIARSYEALAHGEEHKAHRLENFKPPFVQIPAHE